MPAKDFGKLTHQHILNTSYEVYVHVSYKHRTVLALGKMNLFELGSKTCFLQLKKRARIFLEKPASASLESVFTPRQDRSLQGCMTQP